jgi:MFS family permease
MDPTDAPPYVGHPIHRDGTPVPPPRAARAAVTYTFAANGALFGAWAPRIPEVKAELGLSSGALGLALLGLAVGSLVSLPLGGAAASHFGSATATRVAFLAFFPFALLPLVAPNGLVLFVALAVWGLAMGGLDVTMNTQGVSVERRYGRSVLSSFHAAFSLGALLGAGVGSAAAALDLPFLLQQAAFGGVLVAGWLALQRRFVPDSGTGEEEKAPLFARPTGTLVGLGVAAFAALLVEGAVADWSAVHLREDLAADPGAAGLGFVAFSATMTLGRVAGDRLLTRFGRYRVVQLQTAGAALGFAVGLATGTTAGAVVGFALVGFGISCAFPATLSLAGEGLLHPGPALAAVSTCGYLGFLVGPPSVGGLAEVVGLPTALWLLVVLTAAVAAAITVSARRAGARTNPLARRPVQ